jgi:hypothetical protein
MEYPEPETLPINRFNRYMMFERINKGKVDEKIIGKKINQMDWESSLGTYTFFIHVISALGYDHLLRDLFLERNYEQIAEKIKACKNPWSPGWLLDGVRAIDEETARVLLLETKDTYAAKIRASTDPAAVEWLLDSVRGIDEETAERLEKETGV